MRAISGVQYYVGIGIGDGWEQQYDSPCGTTLHGNRAVRLYTRAAVCPGPLGKGRQAGLFGSWHGFVLIMGEMEIEIDTEMRMGWDGMGQDCMA